MPPPRARVRPIGDKPVDAVNSRASPQQMSLRPNRRGADALSAVALLIFALCGPVLRSQPCFGLAVACEASACTLGASSASAGNRTSSCGILQQSRVYGRRG
jgi:hypothetical protein